MREYRFEVSSVVSVPATRFWEHATFADVNAELEPWVRMSAPASWKDVPLREWPAGKRLFRSWVLLFGVIPVDLHSFFLYAIDPDRGFEERSTSLMNARWWHTRTVTPQSSGCVVTDEVRYESRLPLIGALLLPVYEFIFRSRHRTLSRRHGTCDPSV